ncbi:MAG: hypothetical protein QM500_19425 [Methylococcales bacterium]
MARIKKKATEINTPRQSTSDAAASKGGLVQSTGISAGVKSTKDASIALSVASGRGSYKTIRVNDITPDPDQPRQFGKPDLTLVLNQRERYQSFKSMMDDDITGFDPLSYKDIEPDYAEFLNKLFYLAYDIDKNSLIHPINCYKQLNNFIIMQGECRWLSHQLAQIELINVIQCPVPGHIVSNNPTDEMAHCVSQWTENTLKNDLPLADRIKFGRRISDLYKTIHNKDCSVRALTSSLRLSKSQAGLYHRVIFSSKTYQSVIQGEITSLEIAYDQAKKEMDETSNVKPKSKPKNKLALGNINNPSVAKYLLSKLGDDELLSSVDWNSMDSLQETWLTIISKIEKELESEQA